MQAVINNRCTIVCPAITLTKYNTLHVTYNYRGTLNVTVPVVHLRRVLRFA